MLKLCLSTLLIFLFSQVSAQILIKGKVIDAAQGEALPFLSVMVEKTGKGVQTNRNQNTRERLLNSKGWSI